MKYGFELMNPIERWFRTDAVSKRGEAYCNRTIKICTGLAPLDPETDEIPPDWVIDILMLKNLSYKGRVKTIIAHAEEIMKQIKEAERERRKKCKKSQNTSQ